MNRIYLEITPISEYPTQSETFPLMDGYCPDPDFCVKMGGCMSGCTGGPSALGHQVLEITVEQPACEPDATTV